jgi:hypothetical protein
MTGPPLELATPEQLDEYATIFECDRELMRLARKCPECLRAILVCDNGWLDAKASPDGDFGIIKLGPLMIMASGSIDGGSRHNLHKHQP